MKGDKPLARNVPLIAAGGGDASPLIAVLNRWQYRAKRGSEGGAPWALLAEGVLGPINCATQAPLVAGRDRFVLTYFFSYVPLLPLPVRQVRLVRP